jgi:AAA domain-containing protein
MAGSGSLLVLVGVAGSGKTAMAAAVADEARRRGFDVLRASPAKGQPGRLVWAQLLRDTGAPDSLVAGLLADDPGPLDLDAAARRLVSLSPRLIVVDDVDHGGADAVEMLSVIGARCVTAPTAVTALVVAAAPEHVLGRALGRFQLSTGFGLAVSPVVITALAAHGPTALWASLAVATLLSAAAVSR